MSGISKTVKKLFPDDFKEFVPVKRRWWRQINLGLSIVKKKWVALLLIVTASALIFMGVYFYNHFVTLETQVLTDKAQIEAQLQRRKDLIINLTKTVVDYAEHERIMFKYMADKRADSLGKTDTLMDALQEKGLLDLKEMKTGDLEGVLARFLALAEAYPNLKLSSNFQKLMDVLTDTENRIVERRMTYNNSCNVYLTYRRKFPQRVYGLFFGFKQYPFVEVDEDVELFNRVEY